MCKNYFLLMMGGSGTRADADVPKQFIELNGNPIFVPLLSRIDSLRRTDGIVIAAHIDWIGFVEGWVKKIGAKKVNAVVAGGDTRSESVKNGLNALSRFAAGTDIVLLHDVTHPYVDETGIDAVIEAAEQYGGATLAELQYDTCYETDSEGFIKRVADRKTFVAGASPEAFQFGKLFEIYTNASKRELDEMTCAGAAAVKHGIKMKTVKANVLNLKLTYKEDIELYAKLEKSYFFENYIPSNPLLELLEKRKLGIHSGVPSFCSANKFVIEAVLKRGRYFDGCVLIEATSNQVNQYGGYMNMQPSDFRDYVYKISDSIGFPRGKILIGGDHMGPLPWADLPAAEAMERAKRLVRLCVLSGYQKIHLDTSMPLGDDKEAFGQDVIAERGVSLIQECEKAYFELLEKRPNSMHPVYVIGSEVPVPGGTFGKDLEVTKPQAFEHTINTYKEKLKEYGISELWKYVIAVVVQPGCEFGTEGITPYDRRKSAELTARLHNHPDIVFEGHSTDYQESSKLREMVEDGIAILKVGPALTFAVREALFSLSNIEKELIADEDKRANFPDALEKAMLENPSDWENYYKGSEAERSIARKYNYADRCRYYMADARVDAAIQKLLSNINSSGIPVPLLHLYMPKQAKKAIAGHIRIEARELVIDAVINLIDEYHYAVKYNYLINGVFA